MLGVQNRIGKVVCEVGECCWTATHMEYVTVVPWDGDSERERCDIDIALCRRHDQQFQQHGLIGTITAYGDQVVERNQ